MKTVSILKIIFVMFAVVAMFGNSVFAQETSTCSDQVEQFTDTCFSGCYELEQKYEKYFIYQIPLLDLYVRALDTCEYYCQSDGENLFDVCEQSS